MPESIDWPGLMRLGYGALRLSPDAFWSMTPAELQLALEGTGILPIGTDLPMDRVQLDRLMSSYPDHQSARSVESKE